MGKAISMEFADVVLTVVPERSRPHSLFCRARLSTPTVYGPVYTYGRVGGFWSSVKKNREPAAADAPLAAVNELMIYETWQTKKTVSLLPILTKSISMLRRFAAPPGSEIEKVKVWLLPVPELGDTQSIDGGWFVNELA